MNKSIMRKGSIWKLPSVIDSGYSVYAVVLRAGRSSKRLSRMLACRSEFSGDHSYESLSQECCWGHYLHGTLNAEYGEWVEVGSVPHSDLDILPTYHFGYFDVKCKPSKVEIDDSTFMIKRKVEVSIDEMMKLSMYALLAHKAFDGLFESIWDMGYETWLMNRWKAHIGAMKQLHSSCPP